MKGLQVSDFNIGDKVKIANPSLIVQSENELDDVFTVVEAELSLGKWKGVVNDRTGRGYVMANGDYFLAWSRFKEEKCE